jgi:hypothetical protein
MVPYSMCVHYNIEPRRWPFYLKLLEDETLPAGYAFQEGVSVHLIDGKIPNSLPIHRVKRLTEFIRMDRVRLLKKRLNLNWLVRRSGQ